MAGVAQPVPRGTWQFQVVEGDKPVRCDYLSKSMCTLHRLVIQNDSDDTLECDATMGFVDPGAGGLKSTGSRRVVAGRRARTVLAPVSPEGMKPLRSGARCLAREPLPPLAVPPGCAYKLTQAPPLESFYPEAARRHGEQGPVDLEFQVAADDPHAGDIRVIGSSLFPALDQAAINYMGALRFEAPCPATRFRLKVEFRLSDQPPR